MKYIGSDVSHVLFTFLQTSTLTGHSIFDAVRLIIFYTKKIEDSIHSNLKFLSNKILRIGAFLYVVVKEFLIAFLRNPYVKL